MKKNLSKFAVEVERRLCVIGTIEVKAKDAEEAQALVDNMIFNEKKPLQTIDKRIDWHDPEYEDFSFQTTGVVEHA